MDLTTTKIHCIADLHGQEPILPGGDMLIVAGDLTEFGSLQQINESISWIDSLPYEEKIIIGGNHDKLIELIMCDSIDTLPGLKYLHDTSAEAFGLKIWGSPYTPSFQRWYYMKKRGADIKNVWDKIPNDTDILITHGPPYGILDTNVDGIHCGCEELLKAVKRVKPKYHIFGHIHEGHGEHEEDGTLFVNCAWMDEFYRPLNQFQVIEYKHE